MLQNTSIEIVYYFILLQKNVQNWKLKFIPE